MLIHRGRQRRGNNFKGGGGARKGSSRAKVTNSEEDGDDADEGGTVYPRFVSAFAAAARVKNLETRRKGSRKVPRTPSAVNLVKPRFKLPRIMDSGLFRKENKGLSYCRFRPGQ
jgi:hypothetical protein